MFAKWMRFWCEPKAKIEIDESKKVYYKPIIGSVKEVEILRRKSIYYVDFQYREYEYVIRFKNGKMKTVKESRIF